MAGLRLIDTSYYHSSGRPNVPIDAFIGPLIQPSTGRSGSRRFLPPLPRATTLTLRRSNKTNLQPHFRLTHLDSSPHARWYWSKCLLSHSVAFGAPCRRPAHQPSNDENKAPRLRRSRFHPCVQREGHVGTALREGRSPLRRSVGYNGTGACLRSCRAPLGASTT